ncbi:cobalamin B12-binding domain-containing protein [Methylobacterium sp. Leaf108]|uniref:cobalamin B12-binding domain-containing protein n=1 Tax=Methylobacterium sp. Leaf108 TaxID=1736256 RepID=UPI0006F5BA3D|nr:cobalamin B12-binding domain-containing protein [Methylobacterium sp. Leaf108]KQP59690.1 hypothetical protein ASF39_16170 [Methylobacterium sp. Leaf108]
MPAQDTAFSTPPPQHTAMDAHFVAPDIIRRSDVFARRAKLLRIVSADVIPRLTLHHRAEAQAATATLARDNEIQSLAHLVLGTDLQAAIDFVTGLRDRGVSMDTLFVDVLEPAARYLGHLWDEDICDFIDVTLAVGRLQHLLAVFNDTDGLPAINKKRLVLMTTMSDEQHVFGAAMVEKFLSAGGWNVQSEPAAPRETIASLVERRWFAVVGLTKSCDRGLDELAAFIATIRARSCNRAVGIMVGGPVFTADPGLAVRLGADATALNAPAAVVLAQKLFDKGAKTGWQEGA